LNNKKLEELKQKARKQREAMDQGGGNFEKLNYFKPEVGDNLIRFLANGSVDELPYVEKAIHYVPFPQPCQGDDCVMCAGYQTLMDGGDEDKAKRIRRQVKYVYKVMDYGIVNKKKVRDPRVCIYPTSGKMSYDIMEFLDEMDHPFWDAKGGRDFKIKKKVDPSKPKQFGTTYKVVPQFSPSDINAKVTKIIDDGEISLENVYNDYEEAKVLEHLRKLGVGGKTATKVKAKVEEKEVEVEDLDTDDIPFGDSEGIDSDLEAELKDLGVE
jgi:hypothetical protein